MPSKFFAQASLCIMLSLSIAGCRGVLPQQSTHTDSIWESYEAAKSAYDLIETGKTKKKDLLEVGVDLDKLPNVEILNYVDVINRMSPLFQNKLPDGVQKCMKAELECVGYVVDVSDIQRDRYGNVVVDFLSFRRNTEVSGWKVSSTLLFVDDVVVYKSWSGTPSIKAYEKKVIPLGPMQNIGELLGP
ncbi:MAG: hypothetical protein OSB62_02920 [Alphaproteobacteria bacterium]|nr:hypothetical protein [Alphaproteobacteria bacterium]